MKKIDERDTMFARINYQKGSKEYNDYYSKNNDKKEVDDEIRRLMKLYSKKSTTYDDFFSRIVDANFEFLSDIRKFSEGEINHEKVKLDKEDITKRIKKLTKYFGADLVGITTMKDVFYYSHRGRHKENYGDKVTLDHKYGIVFAVEMDKDMINRSPQIEEAIEVTQGYVKAATIGMQLSYFIRNLGYDARNHMDGNYLLIAPRVAKSAGLGDIGRNNILTTKQYGSRVRLGVVTTNLELLEDEESDLDIKKLCIECGKCSENCPSKALTKDDKDWEINQEECFKFWTKVGTDCGICVSSCPLSQDFFDKNLLDDLSDENIKFILKKYDDEFKNRPYISKPLDLIK